MRREFVIASVAALGVIALAALWWPPAVWWFVLVGPLITLGAYDMLQREHTLLRNFPILGRGRFVMEALRPKIYQYFVESDIDGRPINRVFRSVVYQRAKGEIDTTPFGTEFDVYRTGYEWMNHSLAPCDPQACERDPRVTVGGEQCKQPYDASILNVSAMSFGSLSANAVLALNTGARIGRFAHNTGEGGLTSYHLEPGGDLVWQIGTGYFGCRTSDGRFSSERFAERAAHGSVKMIELKLSQGAKPAHGGILPAAKNTPEIARIRLVEPYTEIISPPVHSAFTTPLEMMEFLAELREMAEGKPVGFKLCVGRRSEFLSLCMAMRKTGILPDFITVDGGEGGTGAAPLEYSTSVGTPLREGLAFVVDALIGFDLKDKVRVIASGKILTGFHLVQQLAMGADLTGSARGMMFALGCIQALACNKNTCPTGITTQDPHLTVGLVVPDKAERVANFHRETVRSAAELITTAGFECAEGLDRSHIFRRVSPTEIRRLDEVYPYPERGSLLGRDVPEAFRWDMAEASPERFRPARPAVAVQ